MDLTTYIADAARKTKLAADIGANRNYLYQVATGRRRASEALALAIEGATAGTVTCEVIRPDLLWERDDRGQVTGYRVPLPALDPSREAATSAEH